MKATTESTQVTTPTEREIRTERVFDAPRDRVWRAHTERELVAQWWGRGNKLDIERLEVEPGGRWRFVEHGPEGDFGFEGRFLEIRAPEHFSQTFGWDGMPGHVLTTTSDFEDLGEGRTKVVSSSVFYSTEERNEMLRVGMEQGLNQSYAALDQVLAKTDAA